MRAFKIFLFLPRMILTKRHKSWGMTKRPRSPNQMKKIVDQGRAVVSVIFKKGK